MNTRDYGYIVPDLKSYVPLSVRVRLKRSYLYGKWISSRYPVPAPQIVKLGVLTRYGHPSGIWVESGTFLGDTTRVLARHADRVFTIEPSPELATRARRRLVGLRNVEVLEGRSEDVMPTLVGQLSGTVSFWLDGHTSGGFTYAGESATPIRDELSTIAHYLDRFDKVTVLVDDFRGFGGRFDDDGAYPARSTLVRWADTHSLNWTVEHDIFVAWR